MVKHRLMKKLLCFGLVVVAFSECKKDNTPSCEKWEYYDVCKPKLSSVYCEDYGHQEGTICAGQLQDAKAGKTTVTEDNANVTVTRHYVKKLQ